MTDIITKEFHGLSIRLIIIDKKEWFIAKDLAELLGYKDTPKAISLHCKKAISFKEILEVGILPTLDLQPVLGNSWKQIKIIPESDMWRLLIKSKLPEAEKIENWIMEEVLPQIRKTGSYQTKPIQKPNLPELENLLKFTNIANQFLEIFETKNRLKLLYLDNFLKSATNISPLEMFGIEIKNSYFLPTELGSFAGKSGMEINQIFAKLQFQEKIDGVWKLLEKGEEFGISFQNGNFQQIKWKLESLKNL